MVDTFEHSRIPELLLVDDQGGYTKVLQRGDEQSGAAVVIDERHMMSHHAAVFTLSEKIALGASAAAWLTGLTGAGVVNFISAVYESNLGGIEIELREDVVATGGTPIVPVCRNRATPKVSTFTIANAPTVTDEGSRLDLQGIPAAASPQGRVPMGGGDQIEWILKPATKYGIKIINQEATEKVMYVNYTWYEPDLIDVPGV